MRALGRVEKKLGELHDAPCSMQRCELWSGEMSDCIKTFFLPYLGYFHIIFYDLPFSL